ncbi:MAG: recombination-associated protein RdgC [Rhodocyclaceae bacterium]|nr:recombination-associated protein RdgC [Rhodocyclaceae bacterium]
MWFKNLRLYRLAGELPTADACREALARRPLTPCGRYELISRGFLPPLGEGEPLVEVRGHWLLALGVEQKLLPATVIRQMAQERQRACEKQENRKLSRQEARRIAEQVAEELLPKALPQRRTTWIWIDPQRRRLAIDAGSDARADEAIEVLVATLEDFSPRLLSTQVNVGTAMTDWLAAHEPPAPFVFENDLELKPPHQASVAIRYVRHDIGGEEVRSHIAAGKRVTKLGMSWRERVAFVLMEPLQIRRLNFLDVLKERAAQAIEAGALPQIADFALMTGELSELIDDLLAALGGEKKVV